MLCSGGLTVRILASLSSARAIRSSTSALDRLKFSTLKAYTLTVVIPRSKHQSSASTNCRVQVMCMAWISAVRAMQGRNRD